MKIAAIYFTGTGNSLRTLNYVKENINDEIDVFDVIKDEVVDISKYDSLFIIYPIYAFNAPKPIIDYVKKMEKSEKVVDALIIKNSGEHLFWNNASSLHLASILKRRNIKVRSEYHYLMPYSFIFKHTDYMAYRMDTVTKELIRLDIKDYLNQKYHPIKRFFFDRPFAFFLRIQWWGGRRNGRLYKVDMDKCIKCMKCVSSCPVNNISFKDDKFIFGKNCLMCQRCSFNCPKDAFKLGLFNKWKVVGPYSFKEEKEYQEEKAHKFLKKNYKKYFTYSENRIREAKEKLED